MAVLSSRRHWHADMHSCAIFMSSCCLQSCLLCVSYGSVQHAIETAIVVCVCRHIVALMRKAPESSLRAVYKKHCSSKFGEVAKIEVPVLPEATDI